MSDSVLPAVPTDGGAVASAPEAPPLEPAGFWIRAAARLIDLVVIYALAYVTSYTVVRLILIVARSTGQPLQPVAARLLAPSPLPFVMALLAAFAFYIAAESIHGSTPGKMILGLMVLSERGGFCGLGAALGREAAYFVDSLFFGVPAYLSMKASPVRQRLGDKWAHTIVVRRRSLQPPQRRGTGRFAAATAAACLSYAVLSALAYLLRL